MIRWRIQVTNHQFNLWLRIQEFSKPHKYVSQKKSLQTDDEDPNSCFAPQRSFLSPVMFSMENVHIV